MSADGRRDHDTSYRVSRARRMVGARGQKDRHGRSSPLSLPLRLRIMKAHIDPILSTFVDLGLGPRHSFGPSNVHRPMS